MGEKLKKLFKRKTVSPERVNRVSGNDDVVGMCLRKNSSGFAIFQQLLQAVFGVPRREQWLRFLFAVLFAVCFLIGDDFEDTGTFFANFSGTTRIIRQFTDFCGYFFVAYTGFSFISAAALYIRSHCSGTVNITKQWPLFLFFVLSWAPYLICNFPGSVPHDTFNQFNQALGATPYINHQPAAVTYFYGLVIRFARALGSSDIGSIFIFTIIQTLFLAFVFTKLVFFIDNMEKWHPLTISAVIFFAVYPIWGMAAQGICKDVLYTCFFVLFTIAYTGFVLFDYTDPNFRSCAGKDDKPGVWEYSMLVIGALGMCFSRKNGIHIVVLSSVALLFLKQHKTIKKRAIAILSAVIVVFFTGTGPLYSLLGVKPVSSKEMLSIPLQQIARYVVNYDAEIEPEERKAINAVLDYDVIRRDYNPRLSDNVKGTFKIPKTMEEKREFIRLYFLFLMRHPEVFIEATLHNSYNYYYFADFSNTMGDFQNYTKFEINKVLSYSNYLPFTKDARQSLGDWAKEVTRLPVLRLLNRCGFYTWVLLFCVFSALVRNKPREIIAALPLLLTILVCIASPVNGLHRYMWPVMAAVWIPLGFVFSGAESHGKQADLCSSVTKQTDRNNN